MESTFTAMAGMAILVFLVFAGLTAALVAAGSLFVLVSAASRLLEWVTAPARRVGAPRPETALAS